MSATGRRALRYGLTILVLGAVAVLFWQSLRNNWEEVRAQDVELNGLMVLATLLYAAAVPVSGLLWGQIVNTLTPGPRATAAESIGVHSASWLLKYVPGQVGSVVNKVLWGARKGLSRTLIVITFIYENIFLQLASIVPSVAILLVATGFGVFGDNVSLVLLPLLVLLPFGALMHRPTFHTLLSFASRRILKTELADDHFLSTGQALRLQAGFFVPRVLNGAGFVVTALALQDVPAGEWLPLAAAFVLAGAIGILAVFVPSGLGVREAVIVVFASQYLPTSQAIVLALVARLLTVAADAIVALVYGAIVVGQRQGAVQQ